jgi:hypothetical protein
VATPPPGLPVSTFMPHTGSIAVSDFELKNGIFISSLPTFVISVDTAFLQCELLQNDF